LTACCITEESRVFLTDGEKNAIYEENIANPPTVEITQLSPRRLRTRQTSSSFEKSASIFSFDSLGIGRFYLSSRKTSRLLLKDIGLPFKAAFVSETKQVWITDCENKTVVIFSLDGERQRPSSTNP